jgi:hypothetical protein
MSAVIKNSNKTLWEIFKMPLLMALLTVIGLLSALLGNGVFDVVSWVCLSIPVYACRRLLVFKSSKNELSTRKVNAT